tara:strand:- start:66 stop:191 length:126 start_codon:yes stop_codon:yes gene_type:complete
MEEMDWFQQAQVEEVVVDSLLLEETQLENLFMVVLEVMVLL